MTVTLEELGIEPPRSPGTTAKFPVELQGSTTFDDLGLEQPKSFLERTGEAVKGFFTRPAPSTTFSGEPLRKQPVGPDKSLVAERAGEALKGGAGIVEAAAQLGLVIPAGMAVEAAAGLTGIASLPFGEETAERNIRAVQETAQPALEFLQPRTPIGKDITAAIEKPFEAVAKGGEIAGEFVREKTGSDVAGALTTGAVGVSPLLLPFGKKGVRAGKKAISKGSEAFKERFKERFRPAEKGPAEVYLTKEGEVTDHADIGVFLTKSAKEPGKIQVTEFNELEITGDIIFDTKEQALAFIKSQGLELSTEQALRKRVDLEDFFGEKPVRDQPQFSEELERLRTETKPVEKVRPAPV